MTKIVSLNNHRAKLDEERKIAIAKARKTAHKVFQCTRCTLKCRKCGAHLGPHRTGEFSESLPYRFCEDCAEEYLAYIKLVNGKEGPSVYWHNDEWIEVWSAWLGYQDSLEQYLNSKEFLNLLKELRSPHPEI